jgi:hypothetical protein
MSSPRRFPPPWVIDDETNATCFVVRDAHGYFYFGEEPRRGEWQSISPICKSSYSGEL